MQAPTKHRFTVNEYYRMGETGVLPPDARVELLDGEIINMSPIGPFHGGVAKDLITVFSGGTGVRWILAAGDPLRLDDFSEPQPNLMLLKLAANSYRRQHPGPGDVYLLIEVAETSSLTRDITEKLPLYGRAGVPEVWIVNLNDETIEIYRQPHFTGYGSKTILAKGDLATPPAFPDVTIDVGVLLQR